MSTPVHLTIPEPCHENWQQMTPNEQGRHCLSCQKTVVDFTLMNDQEVLQYISTATSSVCGRFNNDQLNKTYKERTLKHSFTFRYMWQFMVSAFLWVGHSVSAQSSRITQGDVDVVKCEKPKKKRVPKVKEVAEIDLADFRVIGTTMGMVGTPIYMIAQQQMRPPLKTFGIVVDEISKKPIDSVSVRILGSKVDLEVDEAGKFEFISLEQDAKIALVIEAKGYEKRQLYIPTYSLSRVEILLKRAVAAGSPPVTNIHKCTFPVVEELKTVGMVVPVIKVDEASIPPAVSEPTVGKVAVSIEDEKKGAPSIPPVPVTRMQGKIIDDKTKLPVGFATVRIKGSETSLAADEQGFFEWPVRARNEEVTLVISAVGYQTKEVVVSNGNAPMQEILLTTEADMLQAVQITAWPKSVCRTDVVGGVMSVVKVSTADKLARSLKDTLQDWLPIKREVLAYPNPVVKGNQVNVQLNLKKTGPYKLELMDASGRIMHVQALQVAQPAQVASLPTQSVWSAGIYWLRVTNASEKKVYQAKVILQ